MPQLRGTTLTSDAPVSGGKPSSVATTSLAAAPHLVRERPGQSLHRSSERTYQSKDLSRDLLAGRVLPVSTAVPPPGRSTRRDPDWRQLTGGLPEPTDPAEREDLLWQQLEAQFSWYDRQASRNRLAYQTLKVAAILVGALVTVLAASNAPPVLTAACAAAIVVTEGVQQVFQFHTHWITYRATAEALRQHAFQYAAGVAPYSDPRTRRALLADALQNMVNSENTSWASTMRDPPATASGQQ
jgi:hypothetical protein